MFDDGSLNLVLEKAEEAINKKIQDLRKGSIFKETDFTSALLSSLRDGLNGLILNYQNAPRLSLGGYQPDGAEYTLNARVIDSNIRQSEENLSGADILIGYHGPYNNEMINKSALVQAKIYNDLPWKRFSGFPPDRSKRDELWAQCTRMERITPNQSYVVVYSGEGVRFYRSSYYLARGDTFGLDFDQGQDFAWFVRELFACRVGDVNFGYLAVGNLKERLKAMGIKHGFMNELKQR